MNLRVSDRSKLIVQSEIRNMTIECNRIKGINLAQKVREFKSALSLQKDAVVQARQTEKTDFSELSASFVIKDGVAENHDLDMKSPFLRLSGEGQVNLPTSRLDYLARTTVAATSKGQDGADLSALKGLTVPVRLSGPFDALDWIYPK